jgi:hypothetical protein
MDATPLYEEHQKRVALLKALLGQQPNTCCSEENYLESNNGLKILDDKSQNNPLQSGTDYLL